MRTFAVYFLSVEAMPSANSDFCHEDNSGRNVSSLHIQQVGGEGTRKYWRTLLQVSWWPSCKSVRHSKTISVLRGSHQRLPEETCSEMKEKIITVINFPKRKGKRFRFGKISSVEERGEKARREHDKVSHVQTDCSRLTKIAPACSHCPAAAGSITLIVPFLVAEQCGCPVSSPSFPNETCGEL